MPPQLKGALDMEALMKAMAGQGGAMCALVALLIDKGVITRDDALAYFDAATARARVEQGDEAAFPIAAISKFVRGEYKPSNPGRAH